MEFILHAAGLAPDLAAIEQAIADLDPAVLLDYDATAHAVRISAALREDDLLACLRRAGVIAAPQDLERLPSVCCGGCSG